MISAIREIGKLLKDEEQRIDIDGKIISITFSNDSYNGIEIEDVIPENIANYLYNPSSSKGNNPAPFCPITISEKTFKKIQGWFSSFDKIKDRFDKFDKNEILLITSINEILKANEEKIKNDIDEEINKFPKKITKFLTLKIDNKFLGEIKTFQKYYQAKGALQKRTGINTGTCSCCEMNGITVTDKIDFFKFYTTDKLGFVSGGFDIKNSWKNYPVCENCAQDLTKGRIFIEKYLNYKFYSLNYLLIPQMLVGENETLKEIIEILKDSSKFIKFQNRIKKRLTNDEKEMLEFLSEKNDTMTLNFLFLKKSMNAERILILIEDVFPSRIKQLFEAKDFVDSVFKDIESGFTFGTVRTFFSKSDDNKSNSDLNKYFLEIVDKIFRGIPIKFSFLVRFFMNVIISSFINDKYFSFRVKDAMMFTLFLEKLKMLTFNMEEIMCQSIFDSLFEKYGNSLNTSAKRGIFLVGALAQMLLNKQYSIRESKPFLKKLKSLKMNEKDIKALLPQIQNKFEDYDAFDKGKRIVAKEAANYLLQSGENWMISVDEINYYFACGMNLADEVAQIVYENKEESNDKKEE